jgi:hypothetical protein
MSLELTWVADTANKWYQSMAGMQDIMIWSLNDDLELCKLSSFM